MLRPQHWAQACTGKDKRDGAGAITPAHQCKLFWNNLQNVKMVPIDVHGKNVATFHLATGYQNFHTYCANTNMDAYDADQLTEMDIQSMLINDTEDEDDHSENNEPNNDDNKWPQTDQPSDVLKNDEHCLFDSNGPKQTDTQQQIPPPPAVIIDKEEWQMEMVIAQLLHHHYEMGHIPYCKL